MGKKDDAAKRAAVKQRKQEKQDKTDKKRTKKELKESGGKEQDIEAILAEFALKEQKRTAVTVSPCTQPSPRANFSITSVDKGHDLILFGGEYCDGEGTTVFNDVFRWNIDKNEWKLIESLNTPPPRCSHQAVFYKDKVYVFGGEYATLDQFYHYRDMWCLDIKTNIWKEIRASGDVPTARSGHRMVVWRNYIVLFGGFYEAMRDVKWYNDLYLFSFQEEKWIQVSYKQSSQVPKPRSGHQMISYSQDDCIFVYGGYSKEKTPGQKKEGKIHDDLWTLNLKPLISTNNSTITKGSIDINKIVWQKVSKKGHFPTPRCGMSMLQYKNKLILFGGVYDDEGPRHALISTFYNDMYAFDIERKKWYQLGLKQPKQAGDKKSRVKKRAEGDDRVDEDLDEDDDEEQEVTEEQAEDNKYDNGNYFGFIDENGNVVYVDLEEDDGEVDGGKTEELNENINNLDISDKVSLPVEIAVVAVPETILETSTPALVETAVNSSSSVTTTATAVAVEIVTPIEKPSFTSYFIGRKDPCPRINSCLMLKGNSLLIYGGVTEIGDVEATLDDCWTLDLNKRDYWKQLLHGTMQNMVWKGDGDDDETEGTRSEAADSDSDDDDGDSDDSGDDSDDEDIVATKKSDKHDKKKKSNKSSGLKQEIEQLRNDLNMTESNITPNAGESLREFYSRTTDYWTQEVIRIWQEGQSEEVLSEKEIKREGFKLCEKRYNELLPMLARLNELEEQQTDLESHYDKSKKPSKKR